MLGHDDFLPFVSFGILLSPMAKKTKGQPGDLPAKNHQVAAEFLGSMLV